MSGVHESAGSTWHPSLIKNFGQVYKRYANAAIRAVNELLGFLQIGLVSAAVGDLTSLTVGDIITQFERIINNVVITARDQ